jgi:hypothetical protein
MRKQRVREAKLFVHGHLASKWWSQGLSLIWLTPKVAIFVAIRKEAQKKEKA